VVSKKAGVGAEMPPKNDPELATLRKELEELYNTLKVKKLLFYRSQWPPPSG
jgi:hypothetical protein